MFYAYARPCVKSLTGKILKNRSGDLKNEKFRSGDLDALFSQGPAAATADNASEALYTFYSGHELHK